MALHRRVVSAFSPFTAVAALALFFVSSVVTETAASAQATSVSSTELTTLERDLAREADALSTSDCVVACRALASIRRAADRICALDPDARCTAARAKADEATERVRRSCPQCAIENAATPTPAPPPMAKPGPPREQPEHMAKGGGDSTVTAASEPPSESKRGGCAGCALVPSSPIEPRAAGLALAAMVLLVLRRLRRSQHDLRSKP